MPYRLGELFCGPGGIAYISGLMITMQIHVQHTDATFAGMLLKQFIMGMSARLT